MKDLRQKLFLGFGAVLAPRLNFSRNGNQLTISWAQPIWMDGVLKSTPSLNSPVWTPVPGVNCNSSVTVTLGAASQYLAILKQQPGQHAKRAAGLSADPPRL